METLEINTNQQQVSNSLLTGMTARTGIVGDEDDLLILDPQVGQRLSAKQGVRILYEMAKLRGKDFVGWQPVQVDLNFNQTGKLMILREHFDPFPCRGEVIHCSPSDRLVEYVKNECK